MRVQRAPLDYGLKRQMASGAAAAPRTRAARQADFERQIEEKEKELSDGKFSRKDTRREQVEWAALRKILEDDVTELKRQRGLPRHQANVARSSVLRPRPDALRVPRERRRVELA